MRRRHGRVRHPGLLRLFASLAFVAGMLSLPWLVRSTLPKLPVNVRELYVSGGSLLSALDIRSMAKVDRGQKLFSASMERVVQRVKADPRVERVAVVRNATGDMAIQVTERKAAALINLDDLYYADAEGTILGSVPAGAKDMESLPIVTGPWKGSAKNRKSIPEIRSALELMAVLATAGVAQNQISEIHFDEKLGWVLYHVGCGMRIVIGWDGFPTKAKRLKRVLRDFEKREPLVREIDLDFDDRAIVKLKRAQRGSVATKGELRTAAIGRRAIVAVPPHPDDIWGVENHDGPNSSRAAKNLDRHIIEKRSGDGEEG
ncbi:MAG TPA: FtsQ-type POTRA domain-containing protein [Bdellovibrionota bacterium]|nr:FtsQ-type POTRA domain-containing protein [Bdellovibrionota bacterium]